MLQRKVFSDFGGRLIMSGAGTDLLEFGWCEGPAAEVLILVVAFSVPSVNSSCRDDARAG